MKLQRNVTAAAAGLSDCVAYLSIHTRILTNARRMMEESFEMGNWRRHPVLVVLVAAAMVAAIAVSDRVMPYAVPLSFLYLLPMALVGAVASRWQLLTAATLCTVIAEYSDAYDWSWSEGVPRDVLSFMAFCAAGFYVHEVLSRRNAERQHIDQLQAENQARREAEEQLSLLIGSSALAIVTFDGAGKIVQANKAARQMFDESGTSDPLLGTDVSLFLPALGRVSHRSHPERPVRTMMQTQGFRKDNAPFLAEVWFSTYTTTNGPRTAAMIVDASDDLRDREESALEQLLNSSRLAVGAVAHEIRNVSSAIQLVQRNLLTTNPSLGHTADFVALQQLTSTLERMAAVETSQAKRSASIVPLQNCLEELRIVSQAMMRENGIAFEWSVPQGLPSVWADQHGLMQVFLNVLRNAQTALASTPNARVRIETQRTENYVTIRISDNGPGVAVPNELFRPFWATSSSSFGLYLSRAILNSFQADISYDDADPGASFVIALQVASR